MKEFKLNIAEAVQGVVDGTADPIEVYANLNDLAKFIDAAKAEIFDNVLNEAQKFESKTFQYKGFEVQVSEGRKMYDFKHIPQWSEAQHQLKEIEERAKAAALNVNKGFITATNDGEEVQPCIIKFSKPSLTIKQIK
jgi:hypothetical protein